MKRKQQILVTLKLRYQILLGYAAVITVLIGLSVFSFRNTLFVSRTVKKNQISQNIVIALDDATLGISQAERAVRGYMLTASETFIKDYQTGIDNYHTSIQKMEAATQTSQLKEKVKQLRAIGEEFEKVDRHLIELVQSGKQAEAVQLFQTSRTQQLLKDFEALQNYLDEEQDKELEETTLHAINLTKQQELLSWSGALIAIAICLGIAYLISSKISRILEEVATKVMTSSFEIGKTVNNQETIILKQSASVDETTGIIEGVGGSAIQSAQQAEASTGEAKQALALAEDGTKTVGLTVEGISELKDQVLVIANQIVQLSKQTSQISSVSDLVADLANQTNVLALNAGVEAARAGDQGRGFAVIASEIRKLADQSKRSAEEIHALIYQVQESINSAVMVTDEGTKKAIQGIKLAEETGDVFVSITNAVNNMFLNNQQIAITAKQQAVAVQQVVAAMHAINLGSQETATGITNVKNATQELQDATQNLQVLV